MQSVALRLVAEREAEIQAFLPQHYWTVSAALTTPSGETLHVDPPPPLLGCPIQKLTGMFESRLCSANLSYIPKAIVPSYPNCCIPVSPGMILQILSNRLNR